VHIDIFCVARKPPAWSATLIADYQRRSRRCFTFEFHYLVPASERASALLRRDEEGRRLRARAATHAVHIALDEAGRQYDSDELAAQIERWRVEQARIAMLIGGADGLAAEVLAQATLRWSLSRLTLPHLLVQVVLAEQLYRASSILLGHPYHRA
jgi:23S rRNA (pseudouridine1915-N3)-methyltransferase